MDGILTEAQKIHRRNPAYKKYYPSVCVENCGIMVKPDELDEQVRQANAEATTCPICGEPWKSGGGLDFL